MSRQKRGASPPDFSFTIVAEERGQRLDYYLSRRHTELSRSQLKRLIQEGKVLVNDRIVKPGYETRYNDEISGWLPTSDNQQQLIPLSLPLEILYEDEDIIVINKASALVVHPGAGNKEGTLVHGLLAHCKCLPLQGAPLRPGIVHRLDRDTSGAMVVAKTSLAYLDLIRQFKERKVHKEYLALVYGNMAKAEGEIVTGLGRHPGNRTRMAVMKAATGRQAISRWKTEKAWEGLTLLRIGIETGRTHQIRVQFSHLQHPVVGDSEYGGGKRMARSVKSKALQDLLLQVDRQMLHARRLAFGHPRSGEALSFTAPLPRDFAQLLTKLDLLFA